MLFAALCSGAISALIKIFMLTSSPFGGMIYAKQTTYIVFSQKEENSC